MGLDIYFESISKDDFTEVAVAILKNKSLEDLEGPLRQHCRFRNLYPALNWAEEKFKNLQNDVPCIIESSDIEALIAFISEFETEDQFLKREIDEAVSKLSTLNNTFNYSDNILCFTYWN